ncbi:MAG TPA: phage terminase large subunit [Candidatus Nanoarchaeia archaeon]|nr:phage terminase large subunit [Candidatus Nanoarchaeia archaeon]
MNDRADVMREALQNPDIIDRELCKRSLYYFLQYFWDIVSSHSFRENWHIKYLCDELETIAKRVGNRQPRLYDLIVNVPPGSTKTITCSIMFPIWCWTNWPWMRFITASYSGALSLQSADYSRELVRSVRFKALFPDIAIRDDKDTKSNFGIVQRTLTSVGREPRIELGGSRYSTSVGGTLMGFHADVLIVDDPLNPVQAASDVELENANHWMEQTLPTRKTNKDITPTILIMQRLHQDDPSGHILSKQKENIRHICLPGEIRNYREYAKPKEVLKYYKNDLLDPVRMPWKVLSDLEADLGQYGYAGQIGQNPTPPGGSMFKVDHLSTLSTLPSPVHILKTVRYWDKAGTQNAGAYTAGVKMSLLVSGRWVVEDVKRGRWGTEERERIIRSVAEVDGRNVQIWIEQEPGSGGKESAEGTIRNLGGFSAYAERPTGDKVFRADPFSVQVNNGNVMMLIGSWHREFVEELRFFPYSTYKDQVDAASGAFSHLTEKKLAQCLF